MNLNKIIERISNNLPNELNFLFEKNNTNTLVIIILSIFIYTQKNIALASLFSHPFSLIILIFYLINSFKSENFGLAVSLIFLIIVSIYNKRELDNQFVKPIINHEHFETKPQIKLKDTETQSDEQDSKMEVQSEDNNSDDTEESQIEENYVGKDKSKNLNDTFKNLHNAIHELENFINKPNE